LKENGDITKENGKWKGERGGGVKKEKKGE